MIGETIGHYQILRKLGEGGMGEVYLARDTKLDRKIALKVLPPEAAASQERLERFRREAKAVAALNHPNIVTIYSVEEVDSHHFLTMEYVEGKTLSEVVPKSGLSLEKFFEIGIPLADALSAAHEKGIIHRDLKPRNVMVDRDGRIRVLDFGLAKLLTAKPLDGEDPDSSDVTEILTDDGRVVGTAPYMSPEQLRGQPLDARSDIFSLGILYYRMATGRHPFHRGSTADVISAILSADPPPITEVKGDMPRHLGRVIRHCLEKEPSHRFQTTLDVRNELEGLREEVSSGTAARSSESLFPVEPESRTALWRNLALAAATAVAILVGILVVRACTTPLPDLETLAVVPFSNLTGDSAYDHLGEVFSSGLMDRLLNFYGVQLVSRSEVTGLVRKGVSATEIGRKLKAGSVIEGEILPEGPQLRVVVSLTDSATNFVLWTEPYTSALLGLPALEDRVATDLESFLSIPLTARERRQLEKHPELTRAHAHYVRGRQFLAPGLEDPRGVESAADNFRQAIRLHPEMAIAHAALSEALWQLYHRDLDPETLAQAEEHARLALDEDPDLPAAHVALARVQRSSGQIEASIESLALAERNHPNPDQIYREIADSYDRVGELEAAEAHYRRATALDDEDWLNWNRLGALLTKLGRLEEAREAFEVAVRLAPEGIYRPLENLGTIYMYKAEFDRAIEIYERIPGPVAYALHATNIATAYFFKGEMDKAVKNFALAVELDPKDAYSRRNYGDVLLRTGDPEAAEAEYREAVRLMDEELAVSPDDPDLLGRRAMYLAKAGDCETAVSEANELLSGPPTTAYGGHQLAYIYALCGTRDQALAAVRKAIELGISPELMAQEDEFGALRDDPEFQVLTQGTKASPD